MSSNECDEPYYLLDGRRPLASRKELEGWIEELKSLQQNQQVKSEISRSEEMLQVMMENDIDYPSSEKYGEEHYDDDDLTRKTPYVTLLATARRAIKNHGFTKEEAAESYGVKIEDI